MMAAPGRTQNPKLKTQNVLTFVGGKGGVGKTTVAAALAVARADSGERVVAISVDPAHSLGDALGLALGPDPSPLPELPLLSALEIDPRTEQRRFLDSHRADLLVLLERGTYLDTADAAGLVDLSVPGIDELAALFRLRELLTGGVPLVVDTAPTGHTLRLLDLPELARTWLEALQAMEMRSQAVSAALVGAYQPDEASLLLQRLAGELSELSDLLRDPGRTRFILVTSREPVVVAETLRLQRELERRGIAIGGVVVNRSAPRETPLADGVPMVFVPPLQQPPVGLSGLRAFAAYLSAAGEDAPLPSHAPEPRVRLGDPYTPPLDRSLYLVAGKGGVGKTTTAAALALRLSEEGRRVLLLGIDPAGSLGDVLGTPGDPVEGVVEVGERLSARELDASQTWKAFRAEYQAEAERIFAGLSAGGSRGDQSVVARLLDLAPPGIDELAALVEVVDATEDRPYDALVVDTAPTGHFLRLLELPEVALEWTHMAMRLLLKYRDVVAPGDLGEHLLRLARSLRRFQERVRDRAETWLLIVALPDELSLLETQRLLQRLDELALAPGGLLINRLIPEGTSRSMASGSAADLCSLARGMPVIAAPVLSPGPHGTDALAALARSWLAVEAHISEKIV